VTLKMPAFEWVHVQLHQQKGMISLSPPTICNSAQKAASSLTLQQCLLEILFLGFENLPSGDSALDNFAEGSGNSTKFPLIFITLTISFSAFTNLTGTGAGLSNR
ncbi:hypothetical protein ACRWVF_22595, partial [Escherichia coli]